MQILQGNLDWCQILADVCRVSGAQGVKNARIASLSYVLQLQLS